MVSDDSTSRVIAGELLEARFDNRGVYLPTLAGEGLDKDLHVDR